MSDSGDGATRRPIKRRKTLRACDYCRAHRIRCDFPRDHDTCRHCEDYGYTCERVAPAPKDERTGKGKRKRAAAHDVRDSSQGLEPGYLGQSSVSCLAFVSLDGSGGNPLEELYGRYDQYPVNCGKQRDQVMLVGRDAWGNGGIFTPADGQTLSSQQARIADEACSASVLEDLVKRCRIMVTPQFPVISISEGFSLLEMEKEANAIHFGPVSTNSTPPTPLPPIVQLIMAAIPALSRDVPCSIRRSLLLKLHRDLEQPDMTQILETSSIASVQILLMLSWSPELHAKDVYRALSLRWLRSGTAARMAIELDGYRLTCTPSGLKRTDDKALYVFQNDLETWADDLPTTWPYLFTFDVTQGPAILDLLSICVEVSQSRDGRSLQYLFVRPFAWPSQPIPTTITFRPSPKRMEQLISRAAVAVEWGNTDGQFYLDTWSIIGYALMCCVGLQHHAHLATKSQDALASLRLAAGVFRAWAEARAGDNSGEALQRLKFAEFVEMLRDEAQSRTADPVATPGLMSRPDASQSGVYESFDDDILRLFS
ncbi:hypothetical protein Q5752_007099 [Cryptotrichosporon argae]